MRYCSSSIKTLYLGLFCIFLFSCKEKKIQPTQDNPITFTTVETVSNYHINNDSTQPSCNLKISFKYASEYADKAILNSLNQIFISTTLDYSFRNSEVKDALKKYGLVYIDNFRKDMMLFFEANKSNNDRVKPYAYYETLKNEILFNKGGIIVEQTNKVNYKGGVNSYQKLNNYIINLSTGKVVTEDEIFKTGFEKHLSEIFQNSLLKQNKVKSFAELESIGYFGIEEISPNGNISIDEKGITYWFNKGEYSAYKLDPITITIPYEEVKDLLDKESPIYKFSE